MPRYEPWSEPRDKVALHLPATNADEYGIRDIDLTADDDDAQLEILTPLQKYWSGEVKVAQCRALQPPRRMYWNTCKGVIGPNTNPASGSSQR